jgi:signal transduction histidine kinase
LQQHAAEYAQHRVAVFAICPEPVERLSDFAAQHRVTYRLLSDAGSALIRQVGVLNTDVDPSDPAYGIPYPGSYLVDERGVVFEKRFHPDHHVREPMGSLLLYYQLKEYSERLEDMGALAGGVEVLGRHLDRAYPQASGAERAAWNEIRRNIEAACRRIAGVAASLRNFVRLDQAGLQQVDLRQNLDAVLELLKSKLEDRIIVERHYEQIPLLLCRAPQINQALFEVLSNAVEAISGSGTITVGTRYQEGHVVLTVQDSGRGIAAEDLPQLFEPRLRPKDGRMGLGLGLPLAHKIIHEHGGRMEFSIPGQGAMVTMRFPAGA